MADPVIQLQELAEARVDAKAYAVVVNGGPTATTPNRAGEILPSVKKFYADKEQEIAESTARKFYDTKALMDLEFAIQPLGMRAFVDKDAVAANNGQWKKEAGGWARTELQPARGADVADLLERSVSLTPKGQIFPLFVTDKKMVIWVVDGAVSFARLAPNLVQQVTDTISRKFKLAQSFIPFLTTDNRIQGWFERDGGINFAKLSGTLLDTITRHVAQNLPTAKVYALRSQPLTAVAPKCTDGRTLSRLRAQIARVKNGENQKVVIAGGGDSWGTQIKMYVALGDQFLQDDGIVKSGEGFISTLPGDLMPTVKKMVKVGWTTWAAANQTVAPPFGTGPDSAVQWTASTTAVDWVTVSCTEFTILQRNHGGTYRYKVDDGDWVSVTLASDGAASRTIISGLSSGMHKFDIDTVGNTGTVVIGGYLARTNAAGYEFLKMGVGGIIGSQMELFTPYVRDYVAMMQPDLLLLPFTTNDMAKPGATPAIARTALLNMANAYRSAVPDIGIMLIAPALNGRSVTTPQAQYRDVMYQLALENGFEFMNWQDTMGTFDQTKLLGQWDNNGADNAHLSQAGMRAGVRMIYNNFFKV